MPYGPGRLGGGVTCSPFFFFNDTATTEIYTLSLHDALPILHLLAPHDRVLTNCDADRRILAQLVDCLCCPVDRKSTRLNSSHSQISYAVFCLKKTAGRRPPWPSGDPCRGRSLVAQRGVGSAD